MLLNADIQSFKNSTKDRINTDFVLVCLAFIAGVLIFRISLLNIFSFVGDSYLIVLTLGCVFILLLSAAASASAIGRPLVLLYCSVGGYYISAFSGFITQFFSKDTPLIIPCILIGSAYVYVLAIFFVSITALRSSALISRRALSDKKIRSRLVRSSSAILAVAVLMTVLFAFLSKYIFDAHFL